MLPRWIAAVLSVPLLACAAGLAATTGQVVPVESFEEYPLLAFPGQWIVRGDKRPPQNSLYLLGKLRCFAGGRGESV